MTGRYEELDSLRGLAALSVFCGHMYLMFNETAISKFLFKFGIFHFAIAGSEAVILFFVLSGFVLSLPFYSDRKIAYPAYLIRRVCRIYIPYIAAIGLAALGRKMFYTGTISGLSDWFNASWSGNMNASAVMDHIFLVGTFTSSLDNVVWSLVHEMRISLIFPFIMLVWGRRSWKMGVALAIMFSMIGVVYAHVASAKFVGTELYATFHYTAMFVLGAVLARYRGEIAGRLLALDKKFRAGLFIVGIVLYLYAHPSFVLNKVVPHFDPFYRTVIDTWCVALGASIIIISAITFRPLSAMLKNAVIKFIGKISFSLYLSHLTVLLSCVHLLYGKLPLWAVCIIIAAITVVVSGAMYVLIERPAISLGRRLTKAFEKNGRWKSSTNGQDKDFRIDTFYIKN